MLSDEWRHFGKWSGDTLGNGNTVTVETRRAHFLPGFQPMGSEKTPRPITEWVSTYFRHFPSVSSKHSSFTKLDQKSETQKKILKIICDSSPFFTLSNYITFGQNQTVATTFPVGQDKPAVANNDF
jgi:hypothetical protein